MSKERAQRVNQLIKEEISKIIRKEMDFSPSFLVTVTRVETSENLRDTNVFVSVLPEAGLSRTMSVLRKGAGFLQGKINKVLRMRPLPRLNFLGEKETVEAAKIEEILERLKKDER
jgi:ribosome-binding factor A